MITGYEGASLSVALLNITLLAVLFVSKNVMKYKMTKIQNPKP